MQPSFFASLFGLRFPLIVVLLTLGASYLLITRSVEHYHLAQAKLAQQNQVYQQARERLQRSGSEKATIEQYLPTYQALQQQGLIGTEQRINWVDTLRTINRNLKLYGINYQIDAQKPYQGDTSSTGDFQVFQSDMTLHFGLLHENDLLSFFDQLRAAHVGLFQINKCSLQRTGSSYASFGMQPNLDADCTLQWLTLQPKRNAS